MRSHAITAFETKRAVASATPQLSIVIPIFNEEGTIPQLYEQLTNVMNPFGRPYEIIAVDDGSCDRSFALLRELASHDSRLRVVSLRRNFGQTAAFVAGFARARGNIVVTLDADLQNDPADIPRMIETLESGYDVVSGWRVHRQDSFFSRTLPSRIANWLISRATGVSLHDYGCSLKAYRREVLNHIKLYGELHRFIPAIASWQGVAVMELPVNHAPRQAGTSKYGIGRTVRVLLDLLTVRFMLKYRTRPMQVFGLNGLLSVFTGGLIAAYLAADKIFYGEELSRRPLLLLAVLLMILGVQSIGIGLVGELVVHVTAESSSREIYVVREELNQPDRARHGNGS